MAPTTPTINENTVREELPGGEVIYQTPGQPRQMIIDGEIWPPIYRAETIRSVPSVVPRPTDVFVCTYPKCGTTWVQHIVHQLLGKDNYDNDHGMNVDSPTVEHCGKEYCERLADPRIIKSHLPYTKAPKGGHAKYIHVVRNPKDCLVSFFFHHQHVKPHRFENGDFNTFFELFVRGELGHGAYFPHLVDWLQGEKSAAENILTVKYEDMCRDLPGQIKRMGEFIGGKAAEAVEDISRLTEMSNNSEFSAMKKDQGRWFPLIHFSSDFIRKGKVGDWRNHFTKEQSKRIDELFDEYLGNTVAADWWKEDMAWKEPNPQL